MVGGGESGWLAPDPNDPNIIFATGVYGSVVRWDRRTSLSQDITPWPMPNWNTEINERKYRGPWTPMLVFSPIEKNTLYLGTQYVMKTTDGGLHWQQISPDLTGAARKRHGRKAFRSDCGAERERARIWRGVQHCAFALEGEPDLGGQRHRPYPPDARRRQDLAERYAARCRRLEPSFHDRGVAL